jgi:predicted transcriptional regulator
LRRDRRDATRVISDILSAATVGSPITAIVNRVNLNYEIGKKYISFLNEHGMLSRHLDPTGPVRYKLTDRGERLLCLIREIQRELADLFPSPTSWKLKTSSLLSDSHLAQFESRYSPSMASTDSTVLNRSPRTSRKNWPSP